MNFGAVDRELSSKEQMELAALVAQSTGDEIAIFSLNDNGESGRFARSLQAALHDAGLNAPAVEPRFIYRDTPNKPIEIFAPAGADKFLDALLRYLAGKGKVKAPLAVGIATDQRISIWIAPR